MNNIKQRMLSLLVTVCSILSVGYSAASYAQNAQGTGTASAQQAAIAELLAKSRAGYAAPPANSSSPAVVKSKKKVNKYDQFGATPLSRLAFSNVLRTMMPLSPIQLQTLRRMFNINKRASVAFPGTPPKSTSTTILVNLSPGASPPVIRLRSGFISSLVFLDSTGQPWPIQAYDNGDPQAFNIQWDQQGNPATLLVQSNGGYKNANIAVILQGNPTPLMLTFIPGQRAVDYRVDLRVPGLGPNASMNMGVMPSAISPQLLSVLNGVSPAGAKRLQVIGGAAEAWGLGGHLYLRTRLTLMSPSWIATMSSPDGTHAYELMKSPVILASRRGCMVHLTIKGL